MTRDGIKTTLSSQYHPRKRVGLARITRDDKVIHLLTQVVLTAITSSPSALYLHHPIMQTHNSI